MTARAPGRVNLIGDHTDYNGGLCLPFAVPLVTTTTARVRGDDRIRVRSTAFPDPWTGRLADLTLDGRDGIPDWVRYVTGVLWAAREDGWPVPGLDLVVDSEIPLGSGLSSSAALECSVAVAVGTLTDQPLDPGSRLPLAELCRRAETEYVGAPTGGMDQLVSLLGTAGHALLIDFADTSVRQVPLPLHEDGLVVLVTDTGTPHQLAGTDSGYADRRAECDAAAAVLGLPRIGLAWPDDLSRLDDDVQRARARHVLSESARVEDVLRAVAGGDWAAVGNILTSSHASLRGDFAASTPALDLAVATAVDAGALGARLTGGGFGGSTIALVEEELADTVREAVDAAFADAELPAPTHVAVLPADGASVTRNG
ncbi:galactokinase [Nocardioides bizhenqiangii]|uniref:Galactokinase n=1 Tax=Nocardioides bizhenqiangii TaxID=3095076 RepID=A0ABZ0ZJV3_9ACTN|nr:galactokinase [Nocardioides sp. HM61]WQQ24618.1 galactokinase [Nocardioides sp. HM61]